jgi:tetratricopeptide (TPR) repeat protein
MKHSKWFPIIILVLLTSLLTPITARADMAPPQLPPGTNIVPGTIPTQVRMVAETVTLTVSAKPSADYLGQAATEAVFTMRNLGTQTETMEARFPLTFWNNESDGYLKYPEIPDIRILVDGKPTATHRINVEYTPEQGMPYHPTPWAAFSVTFPPGKDVIVTVKYTSNGDYVQTDDNTNPYFSLRYILETGAGWKDTIGSADIIVKLPYEANTKNVLLIDAYGYAPPTSANAKLTGNEIRWHFDNLEPTADDNIRITLVQASTWQKVLDKSAYLQTHPNDGEAWGQLGKAYKEIVLPGFNKGYPRVDPIDPAAPVDEDGREMYQLALQAYGKAVEFLPNDALWHYGFAHLLFQHLRWHYSDTPTPQDISEATKMAKELRQSLALDPNNQTAIDMADWAVSLYPWALSSASDNYDYLILTVTPTLAPATNAPLPEPSSTPETQTQPSPTAIPATDAVPASPTKNLGQAPLPCGGTALLLPALAGLLWLFSRRR